MSTVQPRSQCSASLLTAVGGVSLFLWCGLAFAESVLFPSPLHLTRRIEDPITLRAHTVEEYYSGNRATSISGDLVSVADYGRSELTVIDHAAGTYSVTPFAAIARARQPAAVKTSWEIARDRQLRSEGSDVEVVRARRGEVTVTLVLDRGRTFTVAAMEVILGAAFPGAPGPVHEVLAASRGPRIAADAAGEGVVLPLPVEQTVIHEVGNERVEARNVITRIGNEHAPADRVVPPPGTRRIESHGERMRAVARELDSLKASQ
jgi:hypothetical protein